MQLSRHAFLVVVIGGLLLGCVSAPAAAADGPATGALTASENSAAQDAGHDEETATEEAHHEEGEHSESNEAGGEHDGHETAGQHEADDGHDESGAHGSDGHSSAGPLHLLMEGIQIVLAFVAVGSVVLAGRIYGGEIGRALLVSGAGVTLLALERLWHNLHELGLLGTPSALGRQGLFILATGSLAVGYLFLYQTMNKRMG